MPSGKTHDALTFLLAAPIAAAAYVVTADIIFTVIATVAFLFGGLMFGPDLDTQSKPYARWGLFRIIWFPYRSVFKHRSRWSHGLVFGTLFRVVYFSGAITLLAAVLLIIYSVFSGSDMPQTAEIADAWRRIGSATRDHSGLLHLISAFMGMWIGAASHTVTDIAASYVKTGRVGEFL
jgi:uncharacterized metal-binding protein